MIALEDISALVAVDEVGVHSARIGPFVLKTTLLPVYRPAGRELRVAALVGGVRFHLAGQAVGAAAVEQLPAQDRAQALELGRVLVVLNRINVGVDGAAVILPAGDGAGLESDALDAVLDVSADWLACSDFEPGRLVCELPSADQVGLERLARGAAECRRRDISIALRGFSGSQAAVEAVRAIRPEIVAIEPRWFRHVAAMAPAARLLSVLFESLRTAGAEVHVGGLDDTALVGAGLAAGADLVSGTALARPVLAGAVVTPESIMTEDLQHPVGNIVSLFA